MKIWSLPRKTILLLLFLLLSAPSSTSAQDWYYPMEQYQKRITLKDFGVLIDELFYKDKESSFPFNRFYGYHAGVDLETLPGESEQKVPIYAVKKGKITYIGSLAGYGGVILQSLEGENLTALYGHVKITNLPYKVGDGVLSGEVITYLGDEFSSETSRERKHLHFAIYKGTDLYFRGHEPNLENLNNRWTNPTNYLKEKGVLDPNSQASSLMPVQSPPTRGYVISSKIGNGLFYNIIEIAKRLLDHFGFKL